MAATGTKTTVKLATLTAAAKNDAYSGTEDNILGVNLDVLANDPGSASLYSVWQPIAEPAGTTPATSGQLPIETSATLPSGAVITINGDGTINYNAGNAFQHLGEGDTATDTFSYTVRMANGALSTATVTLTIQGVNDVATISGDNAGTVTEDGALSASGSLLVSDVDDGEAGFQLIDPNQLTGAHGSFTFNNGAWTFDADNNAAQHLGADDSITQSLTVTSIDGTATETITVTVQGTNDAAAISGNNAGTVTEDGTLSASGSLSVSDVDDGEAGFQAVSGGDLSGTYGDFTFDSSTGAWGYSLRNGDSNVQSLNAGDVVYDTLTVKSLDGSAEQEISVAINGADDVVIGNNLGFEMGDFTSWQVLGAAIVQSGGAPEGTYMALLSSYGAWEGDIESFLGTGSSALNNIVSNPTNGAAIKTTLTLGAGDTVSFDWYFNGDDYLPYNDTSFFTSLNGDLSALSNIGMVGNYGDSGWQTTTITVPSSGTYDIGFGVVNSQDTGLNSYLYVDDISIVKYNMGFEAGDFTNWQVMGNANIATGAPEGTYMAHLDSAGAWESDIEAFLGVSSSALDSIVSSPTNGAAIKTTLSLNAGDTVSFNWYFDGGDYLPYNDTSFFTSLNGNLTALSNIAAVGSYGDSGWQTSSFTVGVTGVYDVGFGVVNAFDTGLNSHLYIDNIVIS